MNETELNPMPAGRDPLRSARAFVESVEATLKELQGRIRGGLVAMELVRVHRIRAAGEQLLDCAQALAGSELLVAGSMRQLRPHPLLKLERDLRREITDSLEELSFRAENRAMFEQANAITRHKPAPAHSDGDHKPPLKPKPKASAADVTGGSGAEGPA